MADFTIVRYFCSFFFTLLISSSSLTLTLIAKPVSSATLQSKLSENPNFEPHIALIGDAELVDGGSFVKLTRPSVSSSGILLRQEPFRFVHPPISFSTEFTFSISPGKSKGLALVLVPGDFKSKFSGQGSFGLSGEKRFLGVEFDTAMDGNVGDLNGNHVGVDVGSFVSVAVVNVSSMNLVLNNGEKLKSWIDYDASSKRLEVRLAKLGEARPYNPMMAYAIDLPAMWGGEDVLVGISSANGDSTQISSVYSWKFSLRSFPHSMHSLPADPRSYSSELSENSTEHPKRVCPLAILGGLIFATVCGALMAFAVLFVWAVVASRHTVFPTTEVPVHHMGFKYEKVGVVVEKNTDGVKN
ncbi:L-type lectin-domain containing receptor kinase VIII.2-like [Humulus lupulus]|uniref:L-type lectin-domain containing receptor kinase VIII.2-like n=1 Tax=Humulus lupulus TaxID=3486 RepID=UPI002B4102B9|nr:L-type lectin-domain containing receptor kinase VIII.2-like [Humulus lupulus]